MNSRTVIVSFFFLFLCIPSFGKDETDDFCLWTAVSAKKNVGTHWSVGAYAELRLDKNCNRVNQYYFRPVLYYKFNNWLTAGAQIDFVGTPSGFQMRYIPEMTARYKVSSWSFSIRERYQATWKKQADSWSHVLRTKVTVNYRIPQTILILDSAVEPYYLRDIPKVRIYSGITVAVNDANSIQMQYLREQYFSRQSNNVLWVTYKIKL